jgi:CRISPR-associated protein Cmr6
MSRPLYYTEVIPKNEGNSGLWYDKFCDKWQNDWSGLGEDGKKAWISTVTNRPCGNITQLEQATHRMTKLLEHHQQAPLYYRLESDFVTGLGREHPVENGFAWHHTLGTPYLPGSSIKGMVRAWAEQWADTDKATLKHIFGSESKQDYNFHVGSVIFCDALPTRPLHLKADVMTPHYSPYYQDTTGQTPPADWHSPIPIPFLVVEKGLTFIFGTLPRRIDEQSQKDCEMVQGWLQEALCWVGAGAKTAVGYGRFVNTNTTSAKPTTVDRTTQQKQPTLSAAQELVALLKGVTKSKLRDSAQGYVDKLKRLDCSIEEKQQAAKDMKEFLEQANVTKLSKLNAYRELEKLEREQ